MKINHLVSTVGICGCALWALTLSGCGSSKPMSGLKGKITYKGEAVADAKILVQSPESGAAGVGRTDASGNYQIDASLPPGKYNAVVVPWDEPPPAPAPPSYMPKDNPKIPKKYRIAATSGLTWDVKAGSNEFNVPMMD